MVKSNNTILLTEFKKLPVNIQVTGSAALRAEQIISEYLQAMADTLPSPSNSVSVMLATTDVVAELIAAGLLCGQDVVAR